MSTTIFPVKLMKLWNWNMKCDILCLMSCAISMNILTFDEVFQQIEYSFPLLLHFIIKWPLHDKITSFCKIDRVLYDEK